MDQLQVCQHSESKRLSDGNEARSNSTFFSSTTSTDLKQYIKGASLDLSFKKMNDSMVPDICSCILKSEHRIKELVLYENRLTSHGAIMLFESIRNSALTNIDLYSNLLDDNCMHALGRLLKGNSSVENVDISQNKITDAGMITLFPYLSDNIALKSINISGCFKISDRCLQIMIENVKKSRIEQIFIDGTMVTLQRLLIVPLIENMIKNSSQDKIYFCEWDITDEEVLKLCNMLTSINYQKLVEISLPYNKITSKGARALFNILKFYHGIIKVDLSGNQLDDECIDAVGEILEKDVVKCIKLGGDMKSRNYISQRGIERLSNYIYGSSRLEILDFSFNREIYDQSSTFFVDLAKKTCIKEINLSNTSISNDIQEEINRLLKVPSEDREIVIQSSSKSAAKSMFCM